MDFFAKNAGILSNGQKVSIKGANWFGLETNAYALHGLWQVSFDSMLDFLRQNSFNALRIPVSVELALNLDGTPCGSLNTSVNPGMTGWSAGRLMDHLVSETAKKGILVMFDMHRLQAANSIPELWYDSQYTEAQVITAWLNVVTRYVNSPNVFAVDLKNEPHGQATWGGDAATDWHAAAERIGNAIHAVNPKLLIYVEGVQTVDGQGSWWGGNLAGVQNKPIALSIPDKVVYSPHCYGPSVAEQPYFSDPGFPTNMPAIWDRDFGHVKKDGLGALCIGEWGGWMRASNKDDVWQNAFAQYLSDNEIDFFYWCLNPDSGDTGGLLQDDWVTPVQPKLDLLAKAAPNPTKFNFAV